MSLGNWIQGQLEHTKSGSSEGAVSDALIQTTGRKNCTYQYTEALTREKLEYSRFKSDARDLSSSATTEASNIAGSHSLTKCLGRWHFKSVESSFNLFTGRSITWIEGLLFFLPVNSCWWKWDKYKYLLINKTGKSHNLLCPDQSHPTEKHSWELGKCDKFNVLIELGTSVTFECSLSSDASRRKIPKY